MFHVEHSTLQINDLPTSLVFRLGTKIALGQGGRACSGSRSQSPAARSSRVGKLAGGILGIEFHLSRVVIPVDSYTDSWHPKE